MVHLEDKFKRHALTFLERIGAKAILRDTYLYFKRKADPYFRPRRFRCYGLGLGKSGTHSLSAIFEDNYFTAHEPRAKEVIEMLLRRERGAVDTEHFREFVLNRDRHLWLEIEVSTLLIHYADVLQQVFADAKFILLIRDPFSWINSSWNHLATRTLPPWFEALDAWRYGADQHDYAEEEAAVLAPLNLPSTKAHFRLWGKYNDLVCSQLKSSRLLKIRLSDLNSSVEAIAAFLNLEPKNLIRRNLHRYKAKVDLRLIHRIDSDFLGECAKQYCGDLLGKFYPGIRNVKDALKAGLVI